jgi:hypothetical protein
MKLEKVLVFIIAICLTACSGNKTEKDKIDVSSLLDESEKGGSLEISAESMNSIIGSIPSPLEIATVIKQSGTTFNEGYLNLQENSQLYTTNLEKALGIGIYSGDLGYINIYEKSYLTVNYLSTIKSLAEDINIGQFFDFSTIKRMASNSDKIDSLIYLSTLNFNKMDEFLRNQKRSNMSILMVTGTWAEGFYIATRNYKETKNKDVMEWIGYQKIIVDQLLLGLSAYRDSPYFQKIINDMNSLKDIYKNISLVYVYHEPTSYEADGGLVIVDKSTSSVIITPEQVDQICDLVGAMRTRLVKNI